ncbi:hypothetical protein KA005_20750 [bacterium]|nr:hypothetical protein [bacterium]
MTSKRRDEKGTEYGDWIRTPTELPSTHYWNTNIDYLWYQKASGLWMLKEEKRFGWLPKNWQVELFKLIDAACRKDENYRGFHVIVFEKTNPDDGYIWLDGRYDISPAELIEFLQFKSREECYESYSPPSDLRRLKVSP